MTGDVVVDEGEAVALAPVELAYVRRLLGGFVDVRDGTATFSRVVGHLRLPTRRALRIRSPKAPAASVIAWAAYVDPRLEALRTVTGRVPVGGGEGDVGALLVRLFVASLEDAILRHGLLRQYRRSSVVTETVRGRIDFARLARQGANLAQMPCEIWERGEATRLNRLLAAALAACAMDPVLRTAGGAGLGRVRARMSAITPAVDAQLLDGTRELERFELPFAPTVALARMLLAGVGLLEGTERAGTGFLVNLESLFERTVVRALRDAGIDVVAKSPLPYARTDGATTSTGSTFEVDALCRGLASGDLVVDAKYKRQVSSANLHQMIAYCALTRVSRAVLVVPAGLVADRRAYVFETGGGTTIRVDVHELATDAADVAAWRKNARAMVDGMIAA